MADNKDKAYVAYVTEPLKVGYTSDTAPQHLTLVHPFSAQYHDVALESMKNVAKSFRQFPIKVGEVDYFGPNNDLPVRRIINNPILRSLHKALLDELGDRGAVLEASQYIGENYNPHITLEDQHPKLIEGQRLLVDNLSLILKSQGLKTITNRIWLDMS